jgi:hypothetical protein
MILGYCFLIFKVDIMGYTVCVGGMLLGYGILCVVVSLNQQKYPCVWNKSCFGVLNISHIGKWLLHL